MPDRSFEDDGLGQYHLTAQHGAGVRRAMAHSLPKDPAGPEPGAARWALLIHQIPPKPDYFRVTVWRRLQQVGAVAIKDSVYVLPRTDETMEDFQWQRR